MNTLAIPCQTKRQFRNTFQMADVKQRTPTEGHCMHHTFALDIVIIVHGIVNNVIWFMEICTIMKY